MTVEEEIEEIVHRETRAWNTKDVELLLSIVHPDMVWPWPNGPEDHDPMQWSIGNGRFNRERWTAIYNGLFAEFDLVHNHRELRRIEISAEGDGAFAVVDVDTLWRPREGKDFHWKGRACKVYTRVHDEWKLIMHTGLLDYGFGRSG